MLAEGDFQVPLKTFVLALLLSRGARYFIEGILAVRYGDAVLLFLMAHKIGFAISVAGIIVFLYAISRLVFRHPTATH